MKYIYIMTLAVVITCLLAINTNISPLVLTDADASLMRTGVHSIDGKLSRGNVPVAKTPAQHEDSADVASAPVASTVARYDGSNHSWTFFGKIDQIKDVSIYGRPGTIAQVEFMREGKPQFAWTVIQIDDYYFVEDNSTLTPGQKVLLEVSGEHVSAKGVNWQACASNDNYCENASFIEGGFPVSEDYAELTTCPSNTLIYSGYASDDWINGMLAWKIKIQD
jgi:hypothetical protein